MRDPATATSTASTESALMDFANKNPDFDVLCLIQATSPFITPRDFISGWELMRVKGADSLVTAVRAHRFLWSIDEETGLANAKNYEPLKRPRRQDWDGELVENGAFYMTTKACLDSNQCRLGGKMVLFEMEEHTFCELDSLVDWQIVANMTEDYGYWPPTNWDEDGAKATPISNTKIAMGGAAVLGLGLMLGRLSAK